MATPVDILGVISAVVQILQTTIDIAKRVKLAKDKKGLAETISQNEKETNSLKEIVAIVGKEEALQTKAIMAEVAEIAELGTKLEGLLKKMETADFTNRLMYGNRQQMELAVLTGDITKCKLNLTVKIQCAHVGLTVSADRKFVVQMERMESVDTQLKSLIQDFGGLAIGGLLKGRKPGTDGTVLLQDSDLQELEIEAQDGSVYRDGSRVIDTNMAYDQAIMINGTIGTEDFIEPKHVKILNNVAKDQATMVNAAVSNKVFEQIMAQRLKALEIVAGRM